jgi:hypothetical protein
MLLSMVLAPTVRIHGSHLIKVVFFIIINVIF